MRKFLVLGAVMLSCAASVQAQTVLCESLGNAYRECRIGSSGKIRMVMEMSDRACFEDLTWGTREIGVVWVNRGCRATFSLAGSPVSKVGKNRIVCESQENRREICAGDTSDGVVLVQQLSKSNCVQGASWGFDSDRDQVWVSNGCRGEFFLGRKTDTAPQSVPLDTVVVCESENGKRKTCQADTSAGVQIVRMLSEQRCSFGREWGYDAEGIWVNKGCRAEFVVRGKPKMMLRSITCESQNDARTQCPADTQYGVALVRQLGAIDCLLDESWGFDRDGVWVTNGCHGQFALGGYRLPTDSVPPTASRITCESLDGGDKRCPVDTSRGVGLIRQTSDAECVLNRTWGYDRDGIWVSNGCRAEFAVAR